MATTEEELRRRREQQEFPANSSNAAHTPPPPPRAIDPNLPVDQQGGAAFRGGEATREFVGDTVDAAGNALVTGGLAQASTAEAQQAGFRRLGRGVVDFTKGLFGGEPLPPAPPQATPMMDALRARLDPGEPEGTVAVDTQGETPVGDAIQVAENTQDTFPDVIDAQADLPGARRLGPDGVDVTDVRHSDFIDPAQIPGDIERATFALPPGGGPDETQATGSAEPGQQSIVSSPPSKLQRVRMIRGVEQSDAIVDNEQFGGLEGPIGLDDADLVKFGQLKAQGIEGPDAQNLLIRQKQVAAEMVRAGASELNARANALGFVDTQDGRRIYYQALPGGGLSFVDTDITALQQPKVGNMVHEDALGIRTSTAVLLYPQINPQTGQLDPDIIGKIDLDRYGVTDIESDRAKTISDAVRAMQRQRFSQQEIQDSLDAEFGE